MSIVFALEAEHSWLPRPFGLGRALSAYTPHGAADAVTVWDQAGSAIDTIELEPGSGPGGISIDGDGNIWIACATSGKLAKIAKNLDTHDVDYNTVGIGASSYSGGDMTGFLVASILDRSGDLDGDLYTNAEEVGVGSNPFSAGSTPAPEVVMPVADLRCTVQDDDVSLTWTNRQTYDAIAVLRDGELIATLAGTATAHPDEDLAPGGYHYRVIASRGGVDGEAATCLATVGDTGDASIPHSAIDVADIAVVETGVRKDPSVDLYVLDRHSGLIYPFDGTEELALIPSPFGDQGIGTGIAEGELDGEPVLVLTGRYSDAGEEILTITDMTGTPLRPGIPLSDGTYDVDRVVGLDYDKPSALHVVVEEPEDMDIFTFRLEETVEKGTQVVFVPDLCVTEPSALRNATGMVRVTGVCFSPYHVTEAKQSAIYLLLVGDDAAGNAVLAEVTVADGGVTLTETDVGVLPEAEDLGSLDVSDEYAYVCDVLDTTIERFTPPDLPPKERFMRGDSNGDGQVDIGDAICLLSYLFGSAGDECKEKVSRCEDAGDANDDGVLDIADAISILSHLFAGAGDLPPPFGACGVDPTVRDALTCPTYPPCR